MTYDETGTNGRNKDHGGARRRSVVVVAGVAAIVVSCVTHDVARVGGQAPALRATAVSGSATPLSPTMGERATLLVFWATWCIPCRREMPQLETTAKELATSGVTVIAVAVDDDSSHVDQYAKRLSLTLPVAVDSSGATARAYGIVGIPRTFLIDRGGVIRRTWVGEQEWSADSVKARVLEAARRP